jgi:hypothetical protein
MLKNGTYRLQSPTGLVNEVLLFAPDGNLVGRVKKMNIEMNAEHPDVQGTIEMMGGETHKLLRVKFSARGIVIDGEPKESNPDGKPSRQTHLDDLLP